MSGPFMTFLPNIRVENWALSLSQLRCWLILSPSAIRSHAGMAGPAWPHRASEKRSASRTSRTRSGDDLRPDLGCLGSSLVGCALSPVAVPCIGHRSIDSPDS